MDPDYLLDELEQEWEDVTIISSDMPSIRPQNKNKKLIQDRRSQARQKNANKAKYKERKAKAAAKKKLKKKMKAKMVNSGDNQRRDAKQQRWIVLNDKKESKRHSRCKRHRKPTSSTLASK